MYHGCVIVFLVIRLDQNNNNKKSLDEFKLSIKSWIPKGCPCELCKTYVQGLGYTVLYE